MLNARSFLLLSMLVAVPLISIETARFLLVFSFLFFLVFFFNSEFFNSHSCVGVRLFATAHYLPSVFVEGFSVF